MTVFVRFQFICCVKEPAAETMRWGCGLDVMMMACCMKVCIADSEGLHLFLSRLTLLPVVHRWAPQLPECNGTCGGDVEGIDAVVHGDHHDVVALGDRFRPKPRSLGAEDDGQFIDPAQ